MLKYTFAILFAMFACLPSGNAQTMKEQYKTVCQTGSMDEREIFLQKWEAEGEHDAELYSAYFNFYVEKARLAASGKETFNPSLMKQAFAYANKGIELFPDRLDIRFGKTYAYGITGDYDKYTEELIKVIEYSSVNQNKWQWTDDKPLEDGLKVMTDGIQGYILQLYETKNEKLLPNMVRIAETALKYYPAHTGSLINLAIIYLLYAQYDQALAVLREAESKAPDNFSILGNIAQTYLLKGDTAKAVQYYKQIQVAGDRDARIYATDQIEKLSNK